MRNFVNISAVEENSVQTKKCLVVRQPNQQVVIINPWVKN